MKYDYDLIVIGGGAAGLTSAGLGVTLGAKTMLIERARLGGDCTWYGCVPSKTLLKASKIAHHIRSAGAFGLVPHEPSVPFGKLMSYVRKVRSDVYEEADRPEIFEAMGVDVVAGKASFVNDRTIEVETESGATTDYTARYIVIATGATAFVPPIPGISDVPILTNESLFELQDKPTRLAIIGGGPIGTEMSQAFTRLGTEVTVIDMAPRILGNDEEEMAAVVQDRLSQEGVRYVMGAKVKGISGKEGAVTIDAEVDGNAHRVEADALLMATGRRANIGGLNLDAAGVAHGKLDITVNDRCRTNRKHIYAVGDVTGRYQFTHMSEHMAKVAVTNALLKLPLKIDTRNVPWVTYTDPELAHVGATPEQLEARGVMYRTYRFPFSKIDRAITEGETAGLIKVYAKERNGRIYGADIVGASAGEMIGEIALAMRHKLTLRNISDTIHPYPTFGLGVRRAADQWYVQKQSPALIRILKRIFGYRGPVLTFGPDQIV